VDVLSELELLRAIIETQQLVNACGGEVQDVMSIVVARSLGLTGAEGAAVELLEGDGLVLGSLDGTAVVTVPLRLPVTGEHVGTLEVRSSEPFADHDVELVDALGDLVADALLRARLGAEREDRALHDGLTGLANQRLLLDRLALALARSTRSGEPVTVLFLDLDGFKPVNDALGHDAGDQVLRSVARALAAAVRPSDTVARLGSDEFVVVCEGVVDAYLTELLDRMRRTVASAWPGPLPVTSSVGVARSLPGDSAEAMLARSERAMLAVKQARVLS
jgi:diguanylate cyclase (GGDEF)-like protein